MKMRETALRETAARWLARHDAGLDPAEQAEFQRWLKADPRHEVAWKEVCEPWSRLDAVQALGLAPDMIGALEVRAARRRVRRWWQGCAAAAVVGLGLIAAIFIYPVVEAPPLAGAEPISERLLHPSERFLHPDPALAISSPSSSIVIHRLGQRRMDDGSVIEFDEQALLSAHYSADRREIVLVGGVAHFTVAPDADRPFVVRAGTVEVRAIGTAFSVGRTERAAEIVVTEGRVEVARDASPGALPLPTRGRVLMPYDAGAEIPPVVMLSEEELARHLHWRASWLQLRSAPLSEIVEVLSRFHRERITLEDPSLAGLRLSGRFQADNMRGFVRMLENNYGVEADRTDDNGLLLRRK